MKVHNLDLEISCIVLASACRPAANSSASFFVATKTKLADCTLMRFQKLHCCSSKLVPHIGHSLEQVLDGPVLLLTICRRPPLLPFLGCWKEVHETTHTQAKTPFATRLNPFPKRLCHDNIIAASSSADINDQKLFLLHIVTKSTANTPMGASSALWLHPRQATGEVCHFED